MSTLERILPDELSPDDPSLRSHIERYEFAARHVQGRRVIDVACGSGYGTELLLAHGAAHVLGVDFDADSIAYARARYAHERVEFLRADAMTLEASGYDAAVCLETLEHVAAPAALLARLARLVGRGGIVVASVPVSPSIDVNPYHVHDIAERDLREMFDQNSIRVCAELRQRTTADVAELARGRVGQRRLRPGLLRFYWDRPQLLLRRLAYTFTRGLTSEYLILAGQVVTA